MKKKKKKKYTVALCLPLAFLALQASAQEATTQLPRLHQEHILIMEDTTTHIKTLSGINLQPATKGTFVLDFAQDLTEDAILEITNTAGQQVFRKPLAAADKKHAWRYNVGKLRPDTYRIEVKTSDTTYWTRFKVGK